MVKKITSVVSAGLLLVGCGSSDQLYYESINAQNQKYMEAYKTVENETVQFKGTFEGDITIVKPKKLPQLAQIEKPKSTSELALDWARVVVPAASMVAGMHYNYKIADSSNKYNAKNIESYTGNYENSTVITSSEVSTSTSVTDTSVSTSSSDTQTENYPSVEIDGTNTTVGGN